MRAASAPFLPGATRRIDVGAKRAENGGDSLLHEITVAQPIPITANGIPKEIRALTGIRFAAAAWVVAFHYNEVAVSLLPSLADVAPLFAQGHLAVPFFFILSGFILSHVYFPTYSIRRHSRFIWLRFARLWPVHFATLLVLLAYITVATLVRGRYVASEPYPLSTLPSELAMVRCWFDPKLLWNFPAWSIHCEWFAYLVLFPACFYLLSTVRKRLQLVVVICTLLAAHEFISGHIPGKCGSIIFLFLTGSALYRIRVLWPAANGAMINVVGILVFALASYTKHESTFNLAFACLVLGLSYEQGWLSRLFSSRLLVFGGTISYSLYMTHEVVRIFAGETIRRLNPQGTPTKIMAVVGLIGIALLAAALCHRYIEVPANQWLRNLSLARRRALASSNA
jgi:peptidoglycan/LPS O-acetylase OafA/YrhL